jgi:hypothetical protein
MRCLALTALLGGFAVSGSLVGQSLTEHAGAAAGATIGTAAGKPLGTSIGTIFGDVGKTAATATTAPKSVKPAAKPIVHDSAAANDGTVASPGATEQAGDLPTGAGAGSASRSVVRRREARAQRADRIPAPIVPILSPIVAPAPVFKEPTTEQVERIQVGATASELRAALGPAESTVSIPGDDGHLLEICQYWANGEVIGTVRLDNGRVVSVQAHN